MAKTRTDFSSRAVVLIGLLVASLGLTIVLAWQAQRAAWSHLAAAQNVLREYSLLAADEFARRAISEVGYGGYFRLANFTKNADATAPGDLPALLRTASPEVQRAATLARGFFFYDPATAALRTHGLPTTTALGARLTALEDRGGAEDEPFQTASYDAGGRQAMLVYSVLPDQTLRGYAVDYAALTPWLEAALNEGPLLPTALADGQVTNEVVYLAVTDPNGETLMRSGERYDPYLRIRKVIGDDYQGIFAGFTILASVDPESASSLVIGGLPRSRLPMLLALFLITIALLATALWLYRREQAVLRLREDFVSQASHELRTPLTQIRMFAETLLLDRTRDEEERNRALRVINREAIRLVQLADNLLKFSARENGAQLRPVEQSIAPILREVCNDFTASGQATDLELQLDQTVRAPVDADALRQVLVNLLDNAVKYGPHDQAIRVTLECDNEAARIAVVDRGPGIPEAEREAVWAPFHRLERERQNGSGGAGIGLSVVRDLVEGHGGRCRFEAGEGGRAIIELPLRGRHI